MKIEINSEDNEIITCLCDECMDTLLIWNSKKHYYPYTCQECNKTLCSYCHISDECPHVCEETSSEEISSEEQN